MIIITHRIIRSNYGPNAIALQYPAITEISENGYLLARTVPAVIRNDAEYWCVEAAGGTSLIGRWAQHCANLIHHVPAIV
jgi:hypothetical protein